MIGLRKAVRVSVLAEDPLVQNGLVSLLRAEPGFAIAGQATAPDLADPDADADVVLWDVGTRTFSLERPAARGSLPTLALVSDEESAWSALRGGALGALFRNTEGERLLAALHAVNAGLGVLEPSWVSGLLRARLGAPSETLGLTPRELEVLGLMAEGLSNKLIGERLKISDHTAKFHVTAILNKLGAETRTEAVVLAARRGLLML